ncbi:MAG: carbamate kinase [Eubacteriales bacterium]|uniref:carbamate kinase n=1 Tax=Fenollaria sp. TaxID=1965292 RepID=UPI002A75AE7A|nr:carbamate kinase [Fenollaria sp.]MDD7339822.1 carbamate kinase [Eubacteriales bacterium]MDY3105910.1 carbamate kinase [Fenollaria sp.]
MKVVVALGGNALGKTCAEQKELVKKTAKPIVDLIEQGNDVTIAHGNGPQVGLINNAFKGDMPFAECGAMSQGYIGYHLQNAIKAELKRRGIKKNVATVITQVLVDKDDKAFQNPTKPIGLFYTKEEADKLMAATGDTYVEDAGRGYRKVIASPKPIDVVEKDLIGHLIEAGDVVITVGGGGIPVIADGEDYKGVAAVIDKDFASEKLAEIVDADQLIILTAVEKVAINFGKENQEELNKVTVDEMKKYSEEGHFAKGSMLPKVEAAIMFAESKPGRVSLITSLEKAGEGIEGKTGTIISK